MHGQLEMSVTLYRSNKAKFSASFSSHLLYAMLILQIFEIIGLVYQYIKLLRQETPEWIFRELQDIGNMCFKFAEEEPFQDDYASNLAGFFYLLEVHVFFTCPQYHCNFLFYEKVSLYI